MCCCIYSLVVYAHTYVYTIRHVETDNDPGVRPKILGLQVGGD